MYPAAFGVAYVLLSFAAFPTPTADLVRPLTIILVSTPPLVAVMAVPLRSLPRAALAMSALIVALSAPFLFAAVVTAGVVAIGVQVARKRWTPASLRRTSGATASRAAGLFALAFAAVGVAVASPSVAGGLFAMDHPRSSADTPDRPNIYLLLLDGYPRTDTLADLYGYDNAWFEGALQELGFEVARESRSNYPHTWLTLTSMLNGAYLEEIDGLRPVPESAVEQYRRLMSALNHAAMIDTLREQGYEIDAIPSPFRSVALTTADRYLDGGQITAFEYSLLMHSQLGPLIVRFVPDFLMSQQRDRFHSALDQLVTEASSERQHPVFVFAHVFSPPHAPLVYGRAGEHLALPGCVPDTCALWEFPDDAWGLLSDQIHYTNGEVLKAVGQIVEDDPEGIIILMSDHGSRRDRSNLDEFFHNFFAARTPGRQVFPTDISPVNVLRLLLSAETDAQMDALPYRAWSFADEERPLDLTTFRPSP